MSRFTKKESLLFVEECFRNIQHEKEISKNLKLIENAIRREYGVNLKISIIDNKKSFFGMCVYPSVDEINALTKMLLETNVRMADVEKLHIEFMTKGDRIKALNLSLLYAHL